MKQAKFHTCKSIFIEHVFQKWKNTQTIPHENIIYNGCNKAKAQYHKAIRNSDYIVGITLAIFSHSLESQTDFILFKYGKH